MITYLAGPMSGMPEWNRQAFRAAAAKLRSDGHFVFDPSESNPSDTNDYRACMAVDLGWICAHATAIALLPGWENSKGARAEHALAVCLDLEIILLG